jgi:hypothetical protein
MGPPTAAVPLSRTPVRTGRNLFLAVWRISGIFPAAAAAKINNTAFFQQYSMFI